MSDGDVPGHSGAAEEWFLDTPLIQPAPPSRDVWGAQAYHSLSPVAFITAYFTYNPACRSLLEAPTFSSETLQKVAMLCGWPSPAKTTPGL